MRFAAIASRPFAALFAASIAIGLSAASAAASPSFVRLPAEMASTRDLPVAAPLPDGKVLIAGGKGRFGHEAPQQRGTVQRASEHIRTAGLDDALSARRSRVCGAPQRGRADRWRLKEGPVWLNTAELFNPATNSFEELPSLMAAERYLPAAATLANGDVLISGGEDQTKKLASAELFVADGRTFAPLAAEMRVGARSGAFAAALPDGQVLVAGGRDTGGSLQSAELFNPLTGPFELLPGALNEARAGAAESTLQDGELLVVGGSNASPSLTSAETFSPATDTFARTAAELTAARAGAAAAPLPNGEVLIVGGRTGVVTDASAEEAIPAPPAVVTTPASAVGAGGATLNGTVLSEAVGSAYFQYGTTTAYGSSTPHQNVPASLLASPLAAAVGGLAPGTTYHYREVAEDAGGPSYGSDQTFTTATPPLVAVVPVITAARESALRWREGSKRAQISRRKPPVGTTFSFSLNEPAAVTFAFTQRAGGHRVGHRCVSGPAKRHTRKACKRTVTPGVLAFTGHAGTNEVLFAGRISKSKKLKPGRYTLMITAADSAGRSSPAKLGFTIVASS